MLAFTFKKYRPVMIVVNKNRRKIWEEVSAASLMSPTKIFHISFENLNVLHISFENRQWQAKE